MATQYVAQLISEAIADLGAELRPKGRELFKPSEVQQEPVAKRINGLSCRRLSREILTRGRKAIQRSTMDEVPVKLEAS